LFEVTAFASLNNGSITSVTGNWNYGVPNNVSDSPLNGLAYNGVTFDNSSNPFVQSRANAINVGVPSAIFQSAEQLAGGAQAAFDDSNGFLSLTTQVYRQHLALAGTSIYFTATNETVNSLQTSLQSRLVIDQIAGHSLAALMFFIGVVGLLVHLAHRHARRNLWLTSPPGSIASIVSLTSRSGFGELLVPYDDEESIKRKLAGLRFRIDRRTGAILAEEEDESYANLPHDDTKVSLLDRKRQMSIATSDSRDEYSLYGDRRPASERYYDPYMGYDSSPGKEGEPAELGVTP